ncbi:hypothetical protein HX780_06590 [Pseudomonas tolaasii]|uniref:hypothetical protein n=1 Tax=Pseudomonas tolaasii TaxID=29442 RepID=UPI0015A16332|nr:hypothetical protein [Pseudomonas tolaasii]NVZ45100.1 hypothetical protein [Pseudomonas tolaasii]NWA47961.1 hypothetical protein [Pseudomonas tolaasii]
MSIHVREAELTELDLTCFHEIRFISYPEDSVGILTLSWPAPGKLERELLRVLVDKPNDAETLARVAGIIVSLRK